MVVRGGSYAMATHNITAAMQSPRGAPWEWRWEPSACKLSAFRAARFCEAARELLVNACARQLRDCAPTARVRQSASDRGSACQPLARCCSWQTGGLRAICARAPPPPAGAAGAGKVADAAMAWGEKRSKPMNTLNWEKLPTIMVNRTLWSGAALSLQGMLREAYEVRVAAGTPTAATSES